MNAVEGLNEKISSLKWLPPEQSLMSQDNTQLGQKEDEIIIIEQHSVTPRSVHLDTVNQDESLDSEYCSWDEEDDDNNLIEDEDGLTDLLTFARNATERLKTLVCRNEGQEDYFPVYENTKKEEKKGAELYYADLLGMAHLNETSGDNVTKDDSRYSIPSGSLSNPTHSRSPEFEILTTSSVSSAKCHWECTGHPKKEVGLGPLEELFSPVVLLTSTNNKAFYDRSNATLAQQPFQEVASHSAQRNYYYDDDKMYEMLMETETVNAFWNRSFEERVSSPIINNMSDFLPQSLDFLSETL